MPAQPLEPQDYRVGWICAVQTEYVVACEFLDEEHPPFPSSSEHDDNTYTLGRIGDHNVVIACLPKGKYGLTSAASVAKDMLRTFPSIRIGLMVGIGGGAPTKKHDIRLGDVVVSSPIGRSGGVIHYDFGKTVQDKAFERTGSLDAPPPMLLTALNKLNALHERKGHQIASSVEQMVHNNPRLKRKYQRPDPDTDVLYKATFVHADASEECQASCNAGTPEVIARYTRDAEQDDPVIHYGLIASANRLMKDARVRDLLAEKEEVLCFEMEAAGLMDQFPCVVIRGICDYSDTHKNDRWQGYAAATAAAYAKELLNVIPSHHVVQRELIPSAAAQAQSTSSDIAKLPPPDTYQRRQPPSPASLDLSSMAKAIDESQIGDSSWHGRSPGVERDVRDIKESNDSRVTDVPGHGNPVGIQNDNKTMEVGKSNAMASNAQAVKNLPLVVRKSVRDHWESKKPQHEAEISRQLGVSWTVQIDVAVIYAQTKFQHQAMLSTFGYLIESYISSFVSNLHGYLRQCGSEGKVELNTICYNHRVLLIPNEFGPDQFGPGEYGKCQAQNGDFSIVVLGEHLGVNANKASFRMADALNSAPKPPGYAPMLGFKARMSIKRYYDTGISEIRSHIAALLKVPSIKCNPNFEHNFAQLQERSLSSQWEDVFGLTTFTYFHEFLDGLRRYKVGEDELIQEAFQSTVYKQEICLQIVDKSLGRPKHTMVANDGVLYIQAERDTWGVNMSSGWDLSKVL